MVDPIDVLTVGIFVPFETKQDWIFTGLLNTYGIKENACTGAAVQQNRFVVCVDGIPAIDGNGLTFEYPIRLLAGIKNRDL